MTTFDNMLKDRDADFWDELKTRAAREEHIAIVVQCTIGRLLWNSDLTIEEALAEIGRGVPADVMQSALARLNAMVEALSNERS